MKKTVLFFAAVFGCLFCTAQSKIEFKSGVNAGLLLGEGEPALTVQAVNGVRMKTWFLGAGIGVDHYGLRSIPVFGQVRKTFSKKAKSPFVYVDVGHHWPWLTKEDKAAVTEAHGGLYYDAGIGYGVPVLKGSLLQFSAGYSAKHYATEEQPDVWIAIWPRPMTTTYRYDYVNRRLSLKVGLVF